MEEQEILKRTSNTRNPLQIAQADLMEMNTVWKSQYSQIQKQSIKVTYFSQKVSKLV